MRSTCSSGSLADDPAAGGTVEREGVGKALHLDGVLDPHLLLGRQRERGPVPGQLLGFVRVGVERHLDLDHLFERVSVLRFDRCNPSPALPESSV